MMILRGIIALILSILPLTVSAFDEEKFAASLGLELVSEGHPYNFLGVNRMYVNDSLTRQMLVMSDVKAELKETRILKERGFFILEVPKDDKTYTSMALVGITEEEIRQHVKTTSVWKTILRELNPIPMAIANDDCGIFEEHSMASLDPLKKFYGSSFAKGALECVSSFLQGVWDSTGGRIGSLASGLTKLISNPREFWNEKVQGLKNVVDFIKSFDVKMKEVYDNFVELPPETKSMLLCNFIGGLGTDIAIAVLTAGAGAANLALRMESYISKLMKMGKIFEVLKNVGKLELIPPDFFKALSSNKISNKKLEEINTFAQHDMPDVVMGAMACAL